MTVSILMTVFQYLQEATRPDSSRNTFAADVLTDRTRLVHEDNDASDRGRFRGGLNS